MSSSHEIDAQNCDITHLLVDYPEPSPGNDISALRDQHKELPPAYTSSGFRTSEDPPPNLGYVPPPRMTAQRPRPRPDPNRQTNPVPFAVNCCGHHDTYTHACVVTNCCGSSSHVTKACVGINMCGSESFLEKAVVGVNMCASGNDLDEACCGVNACGSRSLLSKACVAVDLCGSLSALEKACCAISCCPPEDEEVQNESGS